MKEVLSTNRKLKKEEVKLLSNFQEQVKGLEAKVSKSKEDIKSALEVNKELLEVNHQMQECMQAHANDYDEPLHHLKEEFDLLNDQLEQVTSELNSTDYLEAEPVNAPTPSDSEDSFEEPQEQSITAVNEEDKVELKSPYIKEWAFCRPSVNSAPCSERPKVPPKQIPNASHKAPVNNQDKKTNEKAISFGESCYVHREGRREKKWLLVGEGLLKISQSEDFERAEVYRLQNVIKMRYGSVSLARSVGQRTPNCG